MTFQQAQNSQVQNTPVVTYSLGNTRNLKWLCRASIKPNGGNYAKWVVDKSWGGVTYELVNDSISIGNPKDEDPASAQNIEMKCQYQHGHCKITGSNMSVGFVFCVVNRKQLYCNNTSKMIVSQSIPKRNVSNLYKTFDGDKFITNLRALYHKALF